MNLLEPLPLGQARAPSRVMFGPHETNLGQHRAISARHVAYYERRAAGGCGVIVTEIASVHLGLALRARTAGRGLRAGLV